MNRGRLSSLLALAWALVAATCFTGCASDPAAAAPPTSASAVHGLADTDPAFSYLAEADYDAVFDAAVRELRDRGFRVARNDRRFGVITTYPKDSPTLFEPWLGDNTTGELARRSTLNDLRRVVTVALAPLPETESAVPVMDEYRMRITVALERRQMPNRYLTHSARGTIAASYRDVPAHLAQRGIPATYWEPAGEDPALATELMHAIGERGHREDWQGWFEAQGIDTD